MKAWCCPLRTFVCCCRQTSIVWAVVVYSLGRGHVVMSWVDCLVLAVVRWGQWTIAKRHFRWVISSFILVQSSINWWWAELMLSHSWRRLIPPLPPRVPQDTPLKPLFGKMTRESARIGRGESGHDMANQLHYNIFLFFYFRSTHPPAFIMAMPCPMWQTCPGSSLCRRVHAISSKTIMKKLTLML